MIWGLFAALAGFLLPAALAIRLVGEVVRSLVRVDHPAVLWRLSIFLLLTIPIIASLPAVLTLLTATPTRSGALIVRFGETGWGIATLVAKIAAVLVTDAVAPRIADQLEREPVTTLWPGRLHLARDVAVILLCLLLAWIATWRFG